MKKLFSFVVFLFLFALFQISPSYGQNQEPKELTEARNSYNAELQKAIKPVNDRYLPKLEELKKQLTFKGDIKGAVVVEDEITRITSGQPLEQQSGNDFQELREIKKNYSIELGTALKPVKSLYLAKLEVLKQQLALSGALKAALAVEQEMEKVTIGTVGVPPQTYIPPHIETHELLISATTLWVDTGITLSKGENFNIRASGQWSNGGDSPKYVGPNGFNITFPGTILESANLASLIGQVNGYMFPVGQSYSGTSPASGKLLLSINDTPNNFSDNNGSLKVQISHSK